MKKLMLAMMLVSLFALSGCSAESEQGSAPFTLDTLTKLTDSSTFSETLEPLDSEITLMLYGLDEGDVTECASIRSTGSTCEEAAVLICTDNATAERVSDALEIYVDDQIFANEDYRPAEIPKLENAQINVRENTVLFVVANDYNAVS